MARQKMTACKPTRSLTRMWRTRKRRPKGRGAAGSARIVADIVELIHGDKLAARVLPHDAAIEKPVD